MGAHLYNKFTPGMSLRLIRAAWLNEVANLWNYAQGGHLINCDIPDNPGPDRGPRWDLDVDALDSELEARGFTKGVSTAKLAPIVVNVKNADTDDDTLDMLLGFAPEYPVDIPDPENEDDDDRLARIGTSKRAARADHQHPSELAPIGVEDADELFGGRPLAEWDGDISEGTVGESPWAARADHTHPGVCADDVPYDDYGTTADALDEILDPNDGYIKQLQDEIDDLSDAIAELEPGEGGGCDCAELWLDLADWQDAVDEDLDTVEEILGEVTVDVSGHAKVPLTALTGAISGHGQVRCFMIVEPDGSIGHSNKGGDDVQMLLDAADRDGATKLLTDADISDDDIEALDGLAEWKDGADTDLDDLLGWQETVNNELDTLETWADGVDEYHDAMSDWQDAVDADLDQAQTDIATAQDAIESIDADVAALDEWSLSIEEWAAGVDADLDDIVAAIDELEEEVGTGQTYIPDGDYNMATNPEWVSIAGDYYVRITKEVWTYSKGRVTARRVVGTYDPYNGFVAK